MIRESDMPLKSIKNFKEIGEGIYRGAQPQADDFAFLKSIGIKTIVSFRWKRKFVEDEKKLCDEHGMEFISIPLNYTNPPKLGDIREFLEIVDNEEKRPLYVHCMHGVDRTGIMVALFRIIRQGWTVDEAYREMEACGFHKYRLRPFKWQLYKYARYFARSKDEFFNFIETNHN